MSGLCGLVRWDGAAASVEQLEPVWLDLALRGPDGGDCWADGEAALGFRLLATTPEAAAAERLPLRHAPSGTVIVADARLDNREELAAALGVSPSGRGDGELILLAYLRWGDDLALHLLGDFAFAIWDERRRRLLAVRDPMGMRQLHYCFKPGRLLAFATDDWALLAHAEIDAELNEVRVSDALQDLEGADLTSTFYTGILRLPAAHRLVVSDGRLTISRYWQTEPEVIRRRFDPRELAAELRYLLDQSVQARLRSLGRVGSMLSGGLDSSSVAMLAARSLPEPLPTFSAVTRTAGCIETAMVRHVQAYGTFAAHDLVAEDSAAIAAEVQQLISRTNPLGGSTVMIGCLYRLAGQQGCNVLLDGVGGDLLFGSGMALADMLRRGKWRRAWHEARGEHAYYGFGPRPLTMLLAHSRTAFTPPVLRQAWRSVRRAGRLSPAQDLLRPEASRRLHTTERYAAYLEALPSPSLDFAAFRAASVVNHDQLIAREHFDRIASYFGVEPRDPFNDLRLIRFALSLPPEALVSDGWTKHVLREAMAGLLPEEVRWRKGRQHVGHRFNAAAIEAHAPQWKAAVERQRPLLQSWIRPEVIETVLQMQPQWLDPRHRTIIYLAHYLDETGLMGKRNRGKSRAVPL